MLKFLGFVTRKLHKSNKNDGALTFFTDSIFVPYPHLNTTIDNPQISCSALFFCGFCPQMYYNYIADS